VAIFKRRTALTTQPSQLCVGSDTLTYKRMLIFDTATRFRLHDINKVLRFQ